MDVTFENSSRSEDNMVILQNELLDELSKNNDILFKSQQRNEPDLTTDERRKIAEDILFKDKNQFLCKFGDYLTERHLEYFKNDNKSAYEIDFYVKRLKQRKYEMKSKIKNRRLEALKRMTLSGDYFSETEMQKRNPLLYDQLVGRFLTEDEKLEKKENSIENKESMKTLSGILLNQIEIDMTNQFQRLQEENEDNAMEEEDDDEECPSNSNHIITSYWGEWDKTKKPIIIETISEGEKKIFYEEFQSQMHSNFLEGRDNFDYSEIDNNEDYDDLETLERDEQERYFDSESPENAMSISQDNSETEDDPLDAYMNQLSQTVVDSELSNKMKKLETN